jgi:hypothetical protein
MSKFLADSEYDPWWSTQDLYITQTYLNKNMKHTLLKHFTKGKLHLNAHITETILFSQHHPCLTHPVQIYDTFVPRPQTYSIQAFFLTLSTKHLHIITSKATGILCNIFPPSHSRLHTRKAHQTTPI